MTLLFKILTMITLVGVVQAQEEERDHGQCVKIIRAGSSYDIFPAPGLPGNPVHYEGIGQIFGKWTGSDSFFIKKNQLPVTSKTKKYELESMQVYADLKLVDQQPFEQKDKQYLRCVYRDKAGNRLSMIRKM